MTDILCTTYADLAVLVLLLVEVQDLAGLTVDVISDEQTSHTYLMPPSVPRVPVFFLMTPMMPLYCVPQPDRDGRRLIQEKGCGCADLMYVQWPAPTQSFGEGE